MNFVSNSLTPLTINDYDSEYLIEILNASSRKFKDLVDTSRISKVEAITIGLGFTSKVFKFKLEFENNSAWSCILKVPSWEVIEETGLRNTLPEGICELVHTTECSFFDLIKDIPAMPVPEIYHTELESEKRPGCILMQDFSDVSVVINPFNYVSEQLCTNVAKTIARFQANISMVEKEKLRRFENAEQTFVAFQNMLDEELPVRVVKEGFDKELLDKVIGLANLDYTRYAMVEIANEQDAQILAHGDLHGYNILMYKNDDGTMSNRIAAFIDWQSPYQGNPLLDLSRFMTTMVDGCVRRELGSRIVDIYYDALTEECQKKGATVKFDTNTCHTFYEYSFVYHAIFSLLIPRFLRHIAERTDPPGLVNAKVSEVVLRANLALQDALPILEKYNLLERFGK